MIHLIGPGGAGKTTIGAIVAQSLGCDFLDLDAEFEARIGDIDVFIGENGYGPYASANVGVYLNLKHSGCSGES